MVACLLSGRRGLRRYAPGLLNLEMPARLIQSVLAMDEVTTVSPDLQASLICEDVRQEVNGMQTLVGIINMIPARVLPVAILKLCVWTRWSSGIGRFRQVSLDSATKSRYWRSPKLSSN